MGAKVTPSSPGLLWGRGRGGRLGGKTRAREEGILQHQDSDTHLEPSGAESSWRQTGVGAGEVELAELPRTPDIEPCPLTSAIRPSVRLSVTCPPL